MSHVCTLILGWQAGFNPPLSSRISASTSKLPQSRTTDFDAEHGRAPAARSTLRADDGLAVPSIHRQLGRSSPFVQFSDIARNFQM
jgi:hypothetical protein